MTFIRYIGIQIFAYGIDMAVFLAFVYLGFWGPIISNVLGKTAAGVFAFLVHRSFTFRLDKGTHNNKQMYRYFLLLGLNIPTSAVVLGLLLLVINNPVIAKFLSDIVIVGFSFWLSKTWVFIPGGQDKSSSTN